MSEYIPLPGSLRLLILKLNKAGDIQEEISSLLMFHLY